MPPHPLYDESELILQLKGGSEQALSRIVQHYYPKLMGFAVPITKSKQVAEDFVQETFLRLWTKREELELTNVSAWLHKVLANMAYSHLRRLALDNKLRTYLIHTQPTYDTTTEHSIASKEGREILQKAINQLPFHQKRVYQLSREEGLNREEIAQQLGISPNTVKNHLARALDFIRDFVSRTAKIFF